MKIAEGILQRQPDHIDAISLKSVVFLSNKDHESALKTVENALTAQPNNLSLMLLRLQIHNVAKNTSAVEQDYLNLIKTFPDKNEYVYALAKHYADNNQNDNALKSLQSLVEKNPNKLETKLVLMDFLIQKMPAQANKTLATFLSQSPDEAELLFRQASLLLKDNKEKEASDVLAKIVALKPDSKESQSAKIALAKMAFQKNDIESATTQVKEVLSTDKKNKEALLLKARLDLLKNATDDGISSLRLVLRDYPNSDEAMVLLGQAYLKKNSPELAEENFRKALDTNPANFDALIPVVSNLIKNKEASRADELLQKALAVKPDHPGAIQALAQVRLMQQDWSGTQKLADSISAKPNGAAYAKYLSAKISEEQKLYKEAVGQYKEALTLNPAIADALRGLANSYEALKQRPELYAYLQEFMTAHPDNFYPLLIKGQLLVKDGKADDAVKTLTDGMTKWPNLGDFYEAIATQYLASKQINDAIAVLEKGLTNNPDLIRLSVMLASVYEQTGAYDKALSVYDKLIADHKELDIVVNNLVSLLLDHFNTKENIERAVTLSKRFENSDQPYFQDSYGWALFHNGNLEEALNIVKKVTEKAPQTPVFRYHLGSIYYKIGNKPSAIAELEQALQLAAKSANFAEKDAAEKLLQSIKAE
jgi:tetratricopeptide (TPR) repeat protein